jgi:hypothetical protein
MTEPDRTEHTHDAPRMSHPAQGIAIIALAYVAVVAMSVPALSVFADPQLAFLVWLGGAVVFYAMSWRRLIAKGATDYARGFLVLGMTVAIALIAFYVMVAVSRALGFTTQT